ncbi:hypothetical protein DER29_5879 [Micromonospora sp. M71_S20]|uniref:hypothetical protein n=1 Tax=Micromonospora sp. M71_S20 TaxID=592872 RepID=UPI000F1BD8B0|nr:hypothetical protein [Micromonospora sp. M71_S20]RLK12597.1 hypothetical protein DER29_5879 [Micromonospora sp. M71_S20]
MALWLSEADGRRGIACTPADLGEVAFRLGVGHARRLGDPEARELSPGRRPPDWLARDWLRDYTLSRPVAAPVPWEHPVAVALLDEVAAAVVDRYAEGLRGAVAPEEVARAVRLTGAAKYFWLAPMMLGRLGRCAISQTYDARDETEMMAGRRPVLELLARWAAEALG